MCEFVYASGCWFCVTCPWCLRLFKKRFIFRNQFIKIISILGSSDGWLCRNIYCCYVCINMRLKIFASFYIHWNALGQFSNSSKTEKYLFYWSLLLYIFFPFSAALGGSRHWVGKTLYSLKVVVKINRKWEKTSAEECEQSDCHKLKLLYSSGKEGSKASKQLNQSHFPRTPYQNTFISHKADTIQKDGKWYLNKKEAPWESSEGGNFSMSLLFLY